MPDEVVTVVTADPNVPTRDIAGDLVSGRFYQRIKFDLGADGVSTPVSGALPVSLSSQPLPTGASTESTATAISGKLPSALAAGGGLKVEGVSGGVAQPVSGTVAVSNLPATQPVSIASQPLPTGASTAAKQPALGTAGTPSADVISVQGVTSGTPQPVSGTVAVSNFPGTQPVSIASLPALATGSAAIGKLAANDGVDIGDVGIRRGFDATLTATIAIGATTSSNIDLGEYTAFSIDWGANLTATTVTFKAAPAAGGPYSVVKDSGGAPITWTVSASSVTVDDQGLLASLRYIQVVAGTVQATAIATITIYRRA